MASGETPVKLVSALLSCVTCESVLPTVSVAPFWSETTEPAWPKRAPTVWFAEAVNVVPANRTRPELLMMPSAVVEASEPAFTTVAP